MDRHEKIFESIKNSKRDIKILPVNIEVLNCIKEKYPIIIKLEFDILKQLKGKE